QRKFTDDQKGAQTMPRRVESADSLGSPPAGFERRVEVDFGGSERGSNSEDGPGKERNAEGECQHAGINLDLIDARDIAGIDGACEVQTEPRDEQAGRASDGRKQ